MNIDCDVIDKQEKIEVLVNKIEEIRSDSVQKMESKRLLAIEEHSSKLLTPLTEKKKKLNVKLQLKKDLKEDTRNAILSSSVTPNKKKDESHKKRLKKTLNKLERELMYVYGVRFSVVKKQYSKLRYKSMKEVKKYIEKEYDIKSGHSTLSIDSINKIVSVIVLNYSYFENMGSKGVYIYLMVLTLYVTSFILVGSLLIPLYIFMIILLGTVEYFITNSLIKDYKDCALILNTIEDNKDVTKRIEEEALEERRVQATEDISKEIQDIEGEIFEVNADISKVNAELKDYVPEVSDNTKSRIKEIQDEINEIEDNYDDSNRKVVNVIKERDNLQLEIEEKISSRVRNKVIFNSAFFFGFKKNHEPNILSNTTDCIVFFYKDETTMIKFVDDLILNILLTLRVDKVHIDLIDNKYGGNNFKHYYKKDTTDIFDIMFKSKQFYDYISESTKYITENRTSNINRDNEKAVKEGYRTKPYIFSIHAFPDDFILENKEYQVVVRTGNESGLYNYLFLKQDDYLGKKIQASKKSMLQAFDTYYSIDGGLKVIPQSDIDKIEVDK